MVVAGTPEHTLLLRYFTHLGDVVKFLRRSQILKRLRSLPGFTYVWVAVVTGCMGVGRLGARECGGLVMLNRCDICRAECAHIDQGTPGRSAHDTRCTRKRRSSTGAAQ